MAASDIESGEGLKNLGKIKRAGKNVFEEYSAIELGNALGHDKINFIGILHKKASMNFLLKAKKGEQDEETTN